MEAKIQNSEVFEDFLCCRVPDLLRNRYKDRKIFCKLNFEDIQKTVNFTPPFLRTQRLIIFGETFLDSSSIGVGTVWPEDMEGHYNNTIYLAFAGRLMPSTATIHLAHFFPNSSPQAVEGQSIRLDKEALNGGLLQPGKKGSTFYVETKVTKKKLNLVFVETNIMFGQAKFGLIENLKFILTVRHSFNNSIVIPEVG